MPKYCVNKKAKNTGVHEVHETNCVYMSDETNKVPLGMHDTSASAVKSAKLIYENSIECSYCSMRQEKANVLALI